MVVVTVMFSRFELPSVVASRSTLAGKTVADLRRGEDPVESITPRGLFSQEMNASKNREMHSEGMRIRRLVPESVIHSYSFSTNVQSACDPERIEQLWSGYSNNTQYLKESQYMLMTAVMTACILVDSFVPYMR